MELHHRLELEPPEGNYFLDLSEPVGIYRGNLPHWRQGHVLYFVTFRLADSLPSDKLALWKEERADWLKRHPQPWDEMTLSDYHVRFSIMVSHWLDQAHGSCILEILECREIVRQAIRHFDGERYGLGAFVVAPNHVHAIIAPSPNHKLSEIIQSWKSFTAKKILGVEAACHRLEANPKVESASDRLNVKRGFLPNQRIVWQKESYDHIVRSAAALERIESYIRKHRGAE